MKHYSIPTLGGLALVTAIMLPFASGHAQSVITQAQPELATETLKITGQDGHVHRFTVEVARTPYQQEVGEMFRKKIAPDRGMLFVWPRPQESAMWMRNTYAPLDIVFIDTDHRIHAIEENAIPLSEGIISSHGSVGSVLELPGGTTERLGLVVGDRVDSSALKTIAGK